MSTKEQMKGYLELGGEGGGGARRRRRGRSY